MSNKLKRTIQFMLVVPMLTIIAALYAMLFGATFTDTQIAAIFLLLLPALFGVVGVVQMESEL